MIEKQFTATDSCLAVTPTGQFKDTNPLSLVTVIGVQAKNQPVVSFNGEELNGQEASVLEGGTLKVDLSTRTKAGPWDEEWILCWYPIA